MPYKLIKFLVFFVFLNVFLSQKIMARPTPELINGFDILGVKSLVDSTLEGVAGACPVQNEVSPNSPVITENDNSSVKIARLKLFERFEFIQAIFTEDYLKMVGQAKYNQEYCLERPKDVEKEVCDQASTILEKYDKDILKLDEIQAEIIESNQKLSDSDLNVDPFLKLIKSPKPFSSFVNILNEHIRRVKSFVDSSIDTFKLAFTESRKDKLFDFHVRALGFLQKSPIQLEGQESLNKRLLSRASGLLGKSDEEKLLIENEVVGEISEIAVKLRGKYFQRNDQDNDDLNDSNAPVIPTMNLLSDDTPLQDEKDKGIVFKDPQVVYGRSMGDMDRDATRSPRRVTLPDRGSNNRGEPSSRPSTNGDEDSRGEQDCSIITGASKTSITTMKINCNHELIDQSEEVIIENVQNGTKEISDKLKEEVAREVSDDAAIVVSEIFPEEIQTDQINFFLDSIDSRLQLVQDRLSDKDINLEKLKEEVFNQVNRKKGRKVRFEPVPFDRYVFLSTDEDFLKKAKEIQDKIHNIDKSKLSDQQKDAYDLAQSMLQEADQSSYLGETQEAESALELAKSFADIALSLTPGVSVAKDVFELITGKNMVTGEPLTNAEMVFAGIGPLTGGLGKIFSKSKKIKKLLNSIKSKFWRKKGAKATSTTGKTANKIDDIIDEAEAIEKIAKSYGITNPNRIKSFAKVKKPNKRHFFDSLNLGKVEKKNSVIMPNIDVAKDFDLIKSGKAVRDGNDFLVNGRRYTMKNTGTLFPVSGEGIETLNKKEYEILELLTRDGYNKATRTKIARMKSSKFFKRPFDIWLKAKDM